MADKYDYLRIVGKGTFGKAWLVQSKTSQRQYVVKEIQVRDMGEKDRHQAVNEVAILARLKHKNVVRYREAFVSAGTLNIVMSYADGGDLGHQIQLAKEACTSIPETKVMRWFVQILFALVYIHDLKILHRDLKPQNIFLTSDDVIKIGDFGIARTLKNSQDRASTAIGTPYYLSPEICRRQLYNQKSDMWTAGCVIYELLTLRHPFEADDFSYLVLQILKGKYQAIPSIYGSLPGDLVSVLLRVNPERRPTAEQILSIPSILPYVKEYTNRRNKVSTSSRSSTTSETLLNKPGNQPGVVKYIGHVKDSHMKGVTLAIRLTEKNKHTDNSAHPVTQYDGDAAADVVCSAKDCGNVLEDDSVFENEHTNLHKVERTGHAHVTCRNTVRRERAAVSVDITSKIQQNEVIDINRYSSCSAVSQKSNCMTKKSAAVRKKGELSKATQRNLSGKGDGEPCIFDQEGVKTVKRRKYSCMTPVAPKIIQDLETPRSENLRRGCRPIRKQSINTPPVMRLFKKHQGNDKRVNGEGISNISLKNQTRVLHKAFEDECSEMSNAYIVKKQQSRSGNDIRRNYPQNKNSIIRHGEPCQETSNSRDNQHQTKHWEKRKHTIAHKKRQMTSVSECDPNQKMHADSNDTKMLLSNQGTPTTTTNTSLPQNVSCPTYIHNDGIQREVCEVLLACSPQRLESRYDVQAKMELLKMFLEKRLGNKNAVLAYDLISGMKDEGNRGDEIMEELEYLLPQDGALYTPLLLHVKCLEEIVHQSSVDG